MLFFVRLKGALGDSPEAVAVPLMVVRVGVFSFASERLCLSWHGSRIECVFRQPHQTATCSCAYDLSLIHDKWIGGCQRCQGTMPCRLRAIV